jgi:hypothetical protein
MYKQISTITNLFPDFASYGTSIAALNTGAGVLPLHNQS